MQTDRKNILWGTAALFGATFSYGWFAILSRWIGLDLPLFYQTSVRSLITGLIILTIVLAKRKWKKLNSQDWTWITLRSFFGLLAIAAFFVAVNNLLIGTVYFIFFAGLLISGYVLGTLFFKERLTPIKWLSLGLALAGLGLIYSLNVTGQALYLGLSFGSGIMATLWNILPKKVSTGIDALQQTMLDNLILVVLGLLISLFWREAWVPPAFSGPWIANYLFAGLQIITGFLVVAGFRRVEAQIGSLIMLMEAIFGIMLAFLIFGETVNLTTILGGALILTGIALPEILAYQRKKAYTSAHKSGHDSE